MKVITGGVTAAKGFQAASTAAGIKYQGRTDMAMVYSEKPCVAAGTFTTNIVKAAPVKWDQEIVYKHPSAQVIVCNSGIANACTGEEGFSYCRATAKAAAETLNVDENSVLVASTGVIGMQLPIEKLSDGVKAMAPKLKGTLEAGNEAAKAIMTTDTVEKEVAVEIERYRQRALKVNVTRGSVYDLGAARDYIFIRIDRVEKIDLNARCLVAQGYLQRLSAACRGNARTDGGLFGKDLIRGVLKVAHAAAAFVKRDKRGLAEVTEEPGGVFLHNGTKSASCTVYRGVAGSGNVRAIVGKIRLGHTLAVICVIEISLRRHAHKVGKALAAEKERAAFITVSDAHKKLLLLWSCLPCGKLRQFHPILYHCSKLFSRQKRLH